MCPMRIGANFRCIHDHYRNTMCRAFSPSHPLRIPQPMALPWAGMCRAFSPPRYLDQGCVLTTNARNMSALSLCARGGTRTRTALTDQGILSPSCLPFHHPGRGRQRWRIMDCDRRWNYKAIRTGRGQSIRVAGESIGPSTPTPLVPGNNSAPSLLAHTFVFGVPACLGQVYHFTTRAFHAPTVRGPQNNDASLVGRHLERETGLEPATPTLARSCSTN